MLRYTVCYILCSVILCDNSIFFLFQVLKHFSTLFILAFCNIILLTHKDFGLPSELRAQPENPHCLHVTWKKAIGSVTGYRVYCFPVESQTAEIIKDIHGNQDSLVISGLRPDKKYRIGITSLSSETESKLVSFEEHHKMRKT